MEAFHRVAERITYPMVIATVANGAKRAGCLVGFTTQCSIDPPRFVVCLSEQNYTYRVARAAGHLVVHLLSDAQRHLAKLFGSETGDEVDKFASLDWRIGPGGAPIIAEAPAWFGGPIVERVSFGGDHVGFVIEPVEGRCQAGEWGYLDFAAVRDLEPGHPA